MTILIEEALHKINISERYGRLGEVEGSIEWLSQLFSSILTKWSIEDEINKLKKFDPITFYHSIDCFALSALIGKNLNPSFLYSLSLSALIHDIGKMYLPEALVKKESKLTLEEFNMIKQHPVLSENWTTKHIHQTDIQEIVVTHHERIDGSGYPYGVKQHQIRDESKILGIVDVFSALTLPRHYREAMKPITAVETILRERVKFEDKFIRLLINLSGLYPVSSEVLLSNGLRGKILFVDERNPFSPLIEDEAGNVYDMPDNPSVKVTDYLSDQLLNEIEHKTLLLNKYIDTLISGTQEEALLIFRELTDKMRVEEIYLNIIAKSLELIGSMWVEGKVSIAQEHRATKLTEEIMDLTFPLFTNPTQRKKGDMLFITEYHEKHKVAAKLVSQLFELNGWIIKEYISSKTDEEILAFIRTNQIQALAISITMTKYIKLINKTIHKIKTEFPNIIITVGGKGVSEHQVENADIVSNDIQHVIEALNEKASL